MPKITISEVDATKTSSVETLENVVYIPGFSSALINPASSADNYAIVSSGINGVEAGTPKLCKTLNEFYAYFGSEAAQFPENVAYPTTGRMFDTNAVSDTNMFNADDVDPSYIYAKYLLANGIPVVYERMNKYCADDAKPASTDVPHGYITYATGTTPPGTDPDPVPLIGQLCILTADNNAVWRCTGITTANNTTTYSWEDMGIDATLATGTSYITNINDMTFTAIYSGMLTRFTSSESNVLQDKNLFDIKYITSGGYPTFELNKSATEMNDIAQAMVDIAASRGDCIALVDHAKNKKRVLVGSNSVYSKLNGTYKLYSDYGAMFTPWVNYNGYVMPPSFAYLITLADMVKSNSNWLACAGVARGVVPGVSELYTNDRLTNSIANSYTDNSTQTIVALNPITYVKPYGHVIWGNRTLSNEEAAATKASYFLSTRSLISEVKKVAYVACESLMFEQNSDVLWVNFCSYIKPTLEAMKSTYGIASYNIIKNESDSAIKLSATIKIKPILAIEEFEIEVYLTNEDVSVEE